MKKFKKIAAVLLCAVILFAAAAPALAVSCVNYSSWFAPGYQEMIALSLIPDEFAGFDLQKKITREEMCILAVHAFEKITENVIEPERTDYFTDTTSPTIAKACELGIVEGYPDFTFRPNKLITRQEYFKIVENFCKAVAYSPDCSNADLSGFLDTETVPNWALEATKLCVECGYVAGAKTADGLLLNPTGNASRQEAMTMMLRCYKRLREYYYGSIISASVITNRKPGGVTVTDIDRTMYVTDAYTLNVRSSWDTSSTIVGKLKLGDTVKATGLCSNGWVRIAYNDSAAYVLGEYLTEQQDGPGGDEPGGDEPGEGDEPGGDTPVSGSGKAYEIAELAASFVGYRYVYGAESPSEGFDCSGLVYYCYTKYGYSMYRVADDQMNQGTAVSRDELQVGDLLFFGSGDYANHVGIYIGNGNFVHASTPSTGVRINALNETYYSTRFIGARRIVE